MGKRTPLRVKENGERLSPGTLYIAPLTDALLPTTNLDKDGRRGVILLMEEEKK